MALSVLDVALAKLRLLDLVGEIDLSRLDVRAGSVWPKELVPASGVVVAPCGAVVAVPVDQRQAVLVVGDV